ncbi:hypothetical protein PC116_g21398 [Phytophthora cactorum]|uniref:Uncharacterized protein n=1 Tax=Phytophthora cactorum TaxID=29920 RepID=A0A8T1C8L5_9STRA|nr:hypothetical protein PC114_g19101 [Phytophthora cactorum]KAG2916480.1 hypothetical protein PC117_g17707 [Phytophthora cactorum]KAG2992070.1 hypothetical protein PC119_g18755 [Phytophthora cactorum]KAG2999412.1 hypothetical protein PC120_g20908 [Phytophthora cactorum]KAG3141554.1 hypothetical protein C6341_g19703 [Phytophthora cactorum]
MCYVALLFDDGDSKNRDGKVTSFRLNSVRITKDKLLRNMAMYAATNDKL